MPSVVDGGDFGVRDVVLCGSFVVSLWCVVDGEMGRPPQLSPLAALCCDLFFNCTELEITRRTG